MRQARFASRLAGLAALALAAVPQIRGDEAPGSAAEKAAAFEQQVRDVVARASDAICRVEGDDEHGHLRGTGFFVDADGTLLTSYSIGGVAQNIVVTVSEQRFPATRLVADQRAGVAILKVASERPFRFLKFGRSTDLAVASPVVTAGYPLDLPLAPAYGLVAGMDLGVSGRYFATRHIRASLSAQRGQGGSPVLNLEGEVVGVLISMVERNNGIFALPIEAAAKVMHDFRTYGRVRQGWVGVDVREAREPQLGSNVRIQTLREDGPAFAGGVRPGDVLLQIGRWKITNPEDVLNAAFFVTSTEPLPVIVSREGREMKFTIVPVDPPDGSMPSIEREALPVLGSSQDLKGINLR